MVLPRRLAIASPCCKDRILAVDVVRVDSAVANRESRDWMRVCCSVRTTWWSFTMASRSFHDILVAFGVAARDPLLAEGEGLEDMLWNSAEDRSRMVLKTWQTFFCFATF